MPKVLSKQQIEQYHEQGYISPIDVMSTEEASRYAERLAAAEATYSEALNAENRNNAHLTFTSLDELAYHHVVLDAVEDLLGEEFSLWGSVLFIKEPKSKHYVSWHQDAAYMGIVPQNFATPWIALSGSNLETGCMSMIPGSHKEAIQPHSDTFEKDNILTRGQNIEDVDVDSVEHLILNPGQMSIHHARIIHSSQPNKSNKRRIGYALQAFMPKGARQTVGENYWSTVRGNCLQSDFTQLGRPTDDMQKHMIAQRKNVNDNWSNILYHGASKKRTY